MMREWSHQVHIRGSDRDRDRSMPRSSASCYHSSWAGSIRAYVRMRMHAAALQLQRACREAQAGMRGHISRHAHTHIYICPSGKYNTSRALLYIPNNQQCVYICIYNIYLQSDVQLLELRFPSTRSLWLASIYRHLPLTSLSLFVSSTPLFFSLQGFLSGVCMVAAWALSFPCMACIGNSSLVLSSHKMYI